MKTAAYHLRATALVAGVLAAGQFAATAALAQAGDYPNQTIRLVVPFAAGGGTDILARNMAQELTERLDQTVVVENRPGAGSLIGVDHVIHSDPDGYTLLMMSSSYVTNPVLGEEAPYDPKTALAPITLVTMSPTLLVVNPSVEAETLGEFVEDVRENPNEFFYGTFGDRSQPHLSSVLFAAAFDLELEGIPYGGGGPAVTAVVAGEVDMLMPTSMLVNPQVEAGQLRPLALAASERSPLIPDVPTFEEEGFPFQMGTWFGIAAPAGTDPEITGMINTAMQEILSDPDVRIPLQEEGSQVMALGLEDFQQFIDEQVDTWTDVRARGLFD
ncbi:tripartite tricarboxylate transporter substrate binding protein [Pseudoroseicyclus sp. CXY001]|uniref:tripartite tricarboxylate transporter substrate binding protein n=1 Tax=Pseudoroseicyclus sp. CXY001 TaxID=3242492 RepID=UPI00358DAB1D